MVDNIKFGGVIVAAGLSSRMGSFKPLLPFKRSTIIENALFSLLNNDVDKLVVVTGKNSEEMKNTLIKYPVKVIHNPNYDTSDMFTSIRMGLREVVDCDGVYFLPGDCPDVSPNTINLLKERFLRSDYDVYYPCFQGEKGHPPLIRNTCFKTILEYEGSGGLKMALSQYEASSDCIETDDPGCVIDIDYKEDYEKLIEMYV